MGRFRVAVPYLCWVTVDVEANDIDHAEEVACHEVEVQSLVGHGGMDKLIGVSVNQSIACNGEPFTVGTVFFDVEQLS